MPTEQARLTPRQSLMAQFLRLPSITRAVKSYTTVQVGRRTVDATVLTGFPRARLSEARASERQPHVFRGGRVALHEHTDRQRLGSRCSRCGLRPRNFPRRTCAAHIQDYPASRRAGSSARRRTTARAKSSARSRPPVHSPRHAHDAVSCLHVEILKHRQGRRAVNRCTKRL